MAIAFVQATEGQSSGSSTTLTQAYGSSVTSQNILVVGVASSGGVPTLTDTIGNTFTRAANTATNNVLIYYARCKGSGANTITATWGSAVTNRALAIAEYSGLSASIDVTTVTSAGTAGSGTITSSSMTTNVSGDLVLAVAGDNTRAITTWTAGSGYTLRTPATGSQQLALEDQTQSTAGAITASFSGVTSGDAYDILVVSFKPAGTVYARYRIGKNVSSGSLTFTVSLMQGATQIAQWTHSNVDFGFTTYEQVLTASQASSITDTTDLRLRFVTS